MKQREPFAHLAGHSSERISLASADEEETIIIILLFMRSLEIIMSPAIDYDNAIHFA